MLDRSRVGHMAQAPAPRLRGPAADRYAPAHRESVRAGRRWRKIPELIQLVEQAAAGRGGKCVPAERESIIPAFFSSWLLVGTRIEGGERHDGKLRGAERRIEALVNGIAFPTSFRPLRFQHGVHGARQIGIGFRPLPGERKGKNRVIGDEIGRVWLSCRTDTATCRSAARSCKAGRSVHSTAMHISRGRSSRGSESSSSDRSCCAACRGPRDAPPCRAASSHCLSSVCLIENVEGVPALRGDFKRADIWLAAVGFIARHFRSVFVVDLQKVRVGHFEES